MSLPNWFDDTETGAPVINNVAGSTIAALIAVCCTGFNVRSVPQIVVSAGVATAMCIGNGYSAAYGKLVRLSGAAVPALNGDKQLLSVSTDAFTYAAPGVADGTYTASMEARRAPLGWEVAHVNGASTIAIFRRLAPEATATLMRVIDTKAAPASTTSVYVSMVASATDADTVTGEITSSGNIWRVGSASAAAQPWVIVGDDRGFYFSARVVTTGPLCWFGDPELLYPADADGCFMAAGSTLNNYDALGVSLPLSSPAPVAGQAATYFYKTLDGASLADRAKPVGVGSWGHLGTASPSAVVPILSDVYIVTATEIRARMPGLCLPLAVRPFADKEAVTVGARKLVALNFSVANSSSTGQMLFDLASSWR